MQKMPVAGMANQDICFIMQMQAILHVLPKNRHLTGQPWLRWIGGQGDVKDRLVTLGPTGPTKALPSVFWKNQTQKTPSGQPEVDPTSALNSALTNSLPQKSPTAKEQAP